MIAVGTCHQPILHGLVIHCACVMLGTTPIKHVRVSEYLSPLYSRSIALLLILNIYALGLLLCETLLRILVVINDIRVHCLKSTSPIAT